MSPEFLVLSSTHPLPQKILRILSNPKKPQDFSSLVDLTEPLKDYTIQKTKIRLSLLVNILFKKSTDFHKDKTFQLKTG